MIKHPRITIDRLRSLLVYDPGTGSMSWKTNRRGGRGIKAGDKVSGIDRAGYGTVVLDGVRYRTHRLAFFWMTGRWPDPEVDHENRVKNDNRWDNLREATSSQNKMNKRSGGGKFGKRGVSRNGRKYKAVIGIDGGYVHLGTYSSPAEAHAAYARASVELHGEFGRMD